jgi:ubiquinone/menaquinone biosynthesis C-methylase UbiE
LSRDNRAIWEQRPQHFRDARVDALLALLPQLGPGARLLDVGCLDGVLTRRYAERIGTEQIHGIDLALSDAARANGVAAIAFDLNRAEALPYPDASFEVVVCAETLEHIYPTDHLLREIHRVLAPGGVGIVDVPRLDSLLNSALLLLGFQPPGVECSRERRHGAINAESVLTGHVAYFTRRALLSMLRASGFEIEALREAGQRSVWLAERARDGTPVPRLARIAWWLLDCIPWKRDYLVVRVRR